MATVNLSWTAPSSVADVTSIEIYRWAECAASTTSGIAALIDGGTYNAITSLATNASPSYSDTSAPTGNVTYAVVSKNTAGIKLEDSGHEVVVVS